MALTFDDGPDPAATPLLLDLLADRGVTATFFVTGRKAAAHPELVRDILRKGHSVGNHSFHHSFLFSFRSTRRVFEEIMKTQRTLGDLGASPLVFRPPGGIVSPRLKSPVEKAGLRVVNFSCRALDLGNHRIAGLSRRILSCIHPGAIVMLHDSLPFDDAGAVAPAWLSEITRVVDGIRQQGYAIRPLADIVGRPVMKRVPPPDTGREEAA